MTEEIKAKLDLNGIKDLENYITNLQKENLALARENEQEKQFIKDCGFENTQQLALEYIGLREEKEDYKQRNEKAVEYIKNNALFTETYDYDDEDNLIWNGATDEKESEELLKILEGGDE